MSKKIFSKIIIVLLISSLFNFTFIYNSSAAMVIGQKVDITKEKQVVDSITVNGITVDAIYTNGSYADNDTTYCCAAFVKKFYSTVYGITVYNLLEKTTPLISGSSEQFNLTSNPKIGDIIRFNSLVHWAIVKSISGNTITVIQQNYCPSTHLYTWVNCTIDKTDPLYSFFTYSKSTGGTGTTSSAPVLYTPSNNATIQAGTSTYFSWSNIGAARYKIRFINNSTGAGTADINVNGTSCSFTPKDSGSWSWKVCAFPDTGIEGIYSGSLNFTVPATATPTPIPSSQSAPVLYTPSNNATIQAGTSTYFSWSNIGAARYKIRFINNSTGAGTADINVNGTSCSFTPKDSGSWSWKVCAFPDTGIEGIYSSSLNFTVPATATPTPSVTAPSLNNPSSNATIQVNINTYFSWSNTGASRYQFQITNPAGSDDSVYTSGRSCNYMPNTSGTWHWKVRKNTDTGVTGDWSEERYFTVPATATPTQSVTAPSLNNPSSNATIQVNINTYFSWSNTGASRYQFQITNPAGSDDNVYTSGRSCNYMPNKSGTWHWKVRKNTDTGVTGDWSEERYFTVPAIENDMVNNNENVVAELPGPYLITQSTLNLSEIYLYFSNKLDVVSAQITSNYRIDGVVIKSAILTSNSTDDGATVCLILLDGSIKYTGTRTISITGVKGYNGIYSDITSFTKDIAIIDTSENSEKVTSININKTSVSIKVGRKLQLTSTVSPANAVNKSVTWKSSNINIATVSSKGVVKGIKKGTAYIYAYSADGNIRAKCKVKVANSSSSNNTGNTASNIVNVGIVAQQGDWIYYRNTDVGSYIYKVKTDGTGKKKLNEYASSYINILGDWIYYSNNSDNGCIYKMKTDGTKEKKLNNDASEYVTTVGDWIYYKSSSDNDHLFKIKTDGTGRIKLSDRICYYVNVVGDWVYYLDFSNGNSINKIRTDGTDETCICYDSCYDLNVVGDWAYYKNSSDNDYLYKIKLDGTEKTQLNEDASVYINVTDNWVYYGNDNEDRSLYKIKTDGTQRTKLCTDTCEIMNVVDNWIYYENVSDERNFYRIKTDGTEREKVK